MLKTKRLKSIIILAVLFSVVFTLCSEFGYAENPVKKISDTPVGMETNPPSILSTNRPPDGLTPNPPLVTETVEVDYGYLSSKEFLLTSSLLLFFAIIIFLKFLLLWKSGSTKGKDIVNNFELTMIIAATVIIIAAGFDAKQIAPALGLFGTVAGYLLGNSKSNDNKGETNK